MPIEIRELVIKATVSNKKNGSSSPSKSLKKDEVVKACVEEVLEILKTQKER